MKHNMSRRKLLKVASVAVAFPALALGRHQAFAASPQLDPENAQAKALEYTHKSSVSDQICGNCRLYTGDASNQWGPCAIFPGQDVASAGWCKAWVAMG